MEETTLQPNELESPATITERAPSQPLLPPPDSDAPAPFSSSDDESDDDGEFEFPFVSRDSPAGTAAPADELFADGRIRPFCPVFVGRGVFHGGTAGQPAAAPAAPRVRGQLGRLFLEESLARSSSVSSDDDDDDGGGGGLEGAPPESYCLWTPGSSSASSPSPRTPRKSSSTGSMARWRRISELVVGRSHIDGKARFMFFPKEAEAVHKHHDRQPKTNNKVKTKPSTASGGRKATGAEVDTVAAAAHRVAYGTPRRTFLPYREELVGLFANVNGVGRSHQHH